MEAFNRQGDTIGIYTPYWGRGGW